MRILVRTGENAEAPLREHHHSPAVPSDKGCQRVDQRQDSLGEVHGSRPAAAESVPPTPARPPPRTSLWTFPSFSGTVLIPALLSQLDFSPRTRSEFRSRAATSSFGFQLKASHARDCRGSHFIPWTVGLPLCLFNAVSKRRQPHKECSCPEDNCVKPESSVIDLGVLPKDSRTGRLRKTRRPLTLVRAPEPTSSESSGQPTKGSRNSRGSRELCDNPTSQTSRGMRISTWIPPCAGGSE